MSQLRIVFAGTPEFAGPSLDALAASKHKLLAVFTQPDRPAGRGRKLTASAVKNWALQHQLPVYQPLNFKDPKAIAELRDLEPDVLVVIAYGLILPKSVLELPPLGCINVHASLLPRWRGASPIQHAILHGDSKSGITIMQMDAGMDTGDMLMKTACDIEPQETAGSLHDKLATLAPEALLNTLDALTKEQAVATAQNHALATYAPKISKNDAKINWQQPAIAIERQIRAFNPWPIAHTQTKETLVRIYEAQALAESFEHPPGTIISITSAGMLVATGDGSVLIKTLQFPGSRTLAVTDWVNAKNQKLNPGMVFL